MSNWWQNLMNNVGSDVGIIKTDITQITAKAVAGAELLPHELDAFVKWAIGQAPTLSHSLNQAAPIIQAVTGLLQTAGALNPEVAAAATGAIAAVNVAYAAASKSVAALNAAAAALHASQVSGAGPVVTDTAAVVAAAQSIAATNQHVQAVSAAALQAAQTIQTAIDTAKAPAAN